MKGGASAVPAATRVASEEEATASQTGAPSSAEPALLGDGHRYRVGARLGRGGMGVVMEAVDPTIRRTVAMKIMTLKGEMAQRHRHRFLQEARITGQLEHPNIVPIHELGTEDDGTPYYTMKLIQGRTLQEILGAICVGDNDTIARFPLSQLLVIFEKVCDAVAFAHSRGVVHRDLKPENIMVGEFGEVHVVDWGAARIVGNGPIDSNQEKNPEPETAGVEKIGFAGGMAAQVTMAGTVIGTPAYMAPEQARGDVAGTGPHSDIYSLGAILYHILTLHRPIEVEDASDALAQALKGGFAPPVHRMAPGDPNFHLKETGYSVPPALSAVAMRAMAMEPDNRYPDVLALERDVEAYRNGFMTSAERPSLVRRLLLFGRRHRREVFFGAAALLLLALTSGAFFARLAINDAELRKARVQPGLSRLVWTSELDRMRAKSYADFLTTSRRLMARERWEEALQAADIAITLERSNPEGWLLKGRLLLLLGRGSEAETVLREGMAIEHLPPEKVALLHRYADWAGRCTVPGEAGAEARRIVAAEMREAGDSLLAGRLVVH